jgi:SAM-dependent methyltransferase
MSSSYRMELDRWLSGLEVEAETVLDIGGSQLPVKGRTASWRVSSYTIADLPEPHKGDEPDIQIDLNKEFYNDDYPHIEKPTDETFDLIFCLEVFDYIWSPKDAIKAIWYLLKDGGTAWVTFPSFYPTHQPIEDDALRYMEGGIRKLAEASGLKIEEIIKRRPESNLLDQFYRAERMRAAKHFDHQVTGYIVRFTK